MRTVQRACYTLHGFLGRLACRLTCRASIPPTTGCVGTPKHICCEGNVACSCLSPSGDSGHPIAVPAGKGPFLGKASKSIESCLPAAGWRNLSNLREDPADAPIRGAVPKPAYQDGRVPCCRGFVEFI